MQGGENGITDTTITPVDKNVFSISKIRSKKFDILSLATGSEDGVVSLYPYPLASSEGKSWESIKSHRSAVTSILYSRDTNLIFTGGEDGNIFIYCIYELPDGENIAFDDNKINNLNQLTNILDEGLGDNVLYPLDNIFGYEEKVKEQHNIIVEYKKHEANLIRDHDLKMRERESELIRKKETEIRQLNDIIKEMKISKDATIDHYEEKIKVLINDHNKILIEKEKTYNDRMDHLSNTIHDLHSKLHFLTNDHEVEIRRKDDEYEKKFKDLEHELRRKFDELKLNNEKLKDDLDGNRRLEELKFVHLDKEHEQEIEYKQEKYEKLLAQLKEEKLKMQNEIAQLKDNLKIKEASNQEKDNLIKKLNEQKEQQAIALINARKVNDQKDKEFNELKFKLNESEKTLQEKSKLASFSSKLKNELYRKNTEIMGSYNKQQTDINELKVNSQSIEKELEESMRLLEHYEKELKKQKLLIDELKKKCQEERDFAKSKESEFDNLLQKIYETFQSSDKNKIIAGIRKIYNTYLSDDVVRKIDSSKLNVNIRDELEKQIDFLQKSLLNVIEVRTKKESIQKSEIYRRTDQNSILIQELNANKKNFTNLEKEWFRLKSENSALKKTLENYHRMEKEGTIGTKKEYSHVYKNIIIFRDYLISKKVMIMLFKRQMMTCIVLSKQLLIV